MKKIFLIIQILAFSVCLSAKEGFTTDLSLLPDPVVQWTSRVYMVYSETEKKPVGSAFLAHHDSRVAYFLSATHVLDGCIPPNSCSLRWGTDWTLDKVGKEFESKMTLTIEEIGFYSPMNKSPISARVKDVAYVRVKPSELLAKVDFLNLGRSFHPSRSEKQTFDQEHFVIGYPYLARRPSLSTEKTITLRISEGFKLESFPQYSFGHSTSKESKRHSSKFLFYSDADSLGGNSGGPVLTKNGALIGILMGGPSTVVYSNRIDYFSHIVPYDTIKFMMAEILFGRLKPVTYK